ncbi:MAG: internal scaffolding protein [Microvirus sp.]|nr:MAG: internal scaffolding protein [Microvirus sp.]
MSKKTDLSSTSPQNSNTSTPNSSLNDLPPTPTNNLRPIYQTGHYRIRPKTYFYGPGRTKQQFKAECDINTIMKAYEQTGQLGHLSKRAPTYADVENIDFQQAMDIISGAKSMFSELPAALRDRFSNDPARLLQFIQNPNNREEALKLGLLAKPVEPATPPPAAVPAAASAAPGQTSGNLPVNDLSTIPSPTSA